MDDRLPISGLLLVRSETRDLEALLPRMLAELREVVVVWDTHGDPATRDAAERLGARVFSRALDGFGPQRAFALAQCGEPWVLWLDADERLDAVGWRAVRQAVLAGGPETAFEVLRVGYFLGRRIRHCGWSDERVLRLFRKDLARFDDAPVHEHVQVGGPPVARLSGRIDHHSYATWSQCVDKLVRYAEANAEKAYREGRRAGPLDLLVRPPLRFARQYVLQRGFLDGVHGLVLCALAATQVLLKYASLWSRRGVRQDGA